MKTKLFFGTLLAATALAAPAFAVDTLIWNGSSGSSWTDSDAWTTGYAPTTWIENSEAIFTSTGEGTVNVTETVFATSVDIGGAYTFNISSGVTLYMGTLYYYASDGLLGFSGSGTVTMEYYSDENFAIDATDFTGTLEISKGWLDVGNSVINSSMTVRLDASGGASELYGDGTVSIYFGSVTGAETTFASNIEIYGTGGAIIRTSDKNVTISGSVTGYTGSELQKNGGGSLTFTGTVDLNEYIAYQGATTFSGSSTKLGTLEFASDASAASSVVFSSSAEVTSLTTEAANNEFTGSLTVSDGATLTVGSVSLSSTGSIEVTTGSAFTVTGNITTSGGILVIASGSTLTATGATADSTATLQGISGSGTLSIEGTTIGTIFTVTTADNFTGTVDVQQGYLRGNGSSIASTASLILHASAGTGGADDGYYTDTNVSLQFSEDGTFAHNITVEGESGAVIFRSGNSAGEITGNVTSATADIQKNGAGSLTYTGTVSIGGSYINYQGTTTFSGETTIGSLEMYQEGSNLSDVVFTGTNAVANVTALTVDASNGEKTANLTVSDGASLTVGSVSVGHNLTVTTTGDTNGNGTFTVTGNITATDGGTFSIADGSTVTATGATAEDTATLQGIAGSGTLSIEGTAITTRFAITTTDDFSGTVNVAKGFLMMDGTSIADTADLVLQTSAGTETGTDIYEDTDVSIHFGADRAELASGITLEGDGGVIIRSNSSDWSGTLSGNISATDDAAAYLQLNGGGSVTLSGSVTLTNGGYINYQGKTTFSGSTVTLGSLDIVAAQDQSAGGVTFSGNTASVGTLTVDSSAGTFTPVLTVKNGASLTVEDLVISHNVAIEIDNATMSITNSVTQDSGTSTSITISHGGTLNLGEDVVLSSATIEIVLSEANIKSTTTTSGVATYDSDNTGVYAITGTGTLGDFGGVTITITVDEAVAKLLSEEGEYTFYIYSYYLNLDDVYIDMNALKEYGVRWGDGTITLRGLPEPALFSAFFGWGAMGLAATRRRRRRVA